MKILSSFALLFALLVWTGCEDDDGTALTTLNYDGANVTAPPLPAGTSSFAVYFPPGQTTPFAGRDLERVSFYVSGIPTATRVSVREAGPDDLTPGAVIESRDISARVNTVGWYEHRLTDPVTLTEAGIWLEIEVEVSTDNSVAIGCDAGRNYNSNGDLLRFAGTTQFASFNDLSPTERVNWNIRGVLSEE